MSLPKYNPQGFALRIFKDRYAIHGKETFGQACERVARTIADAEMGIKRDEYFHRFLDILQTNRFSPGGRIWRGAGRPRGQMLNCFQGDTLVQTEHGIEPIKYLVGTNTKVLSDSGVFRNATWFSAGQQRLYKIILNNGDVLFSTHEHEWPVYIGKNIEKIQTKDLLGKRILIEPCIDFNYEMEVYKEGVRHGLIFGDGCLYMQGKSSILQQFGDSRHLVDDFFDDGRDWPSTGGRVTSKHPAKWKLLPSMSESRSYLRGFIAGLIGSDGCVDNRGHCMIHNHIESNLSKVRILCMHAGIATTSITQTRDINPFNGKEASLYKLTICKGSIIKNGKFDSKLIIKNKHRENLSLLNDSSRLERSSIKVVDITPTDRIEEVFCCTEKETHTFVIDNFYLTGNCFVIPAEDSREGWGDVLRSVTIISGTGGGVGINFSKIRPRGTPIRGTGGEATGSVSLMRAINAICNELREGGGRRAALMYCLKYDHPDLIEFLEAKLDKNELNNANISVCIDSTFLELVEKDENVVFKWQGEERGRIPAKQIWKKIIENSLQSGDPGILNIGLANNMNTISYECDLISTNPCGEIWLSAFDCCCLGAVNLHTHIINGKIDWDMLEETVAISIRFLDNVLDQNIYPLPIIQETCQKYRRIGLGVMGLHDMLIELGLKYSSQDARDFINKIMDCIKKQAYHASIRTAIEKGSFHALDMDRHVKTGFAKKCLTRNHHRLIKEHGIRNCALLCIAPTGTTSIVAGCSSGIEPLFHPIYERRFNQHKDMHDDSKRNKAVEIVIHPLLKRFVENKRSIEHFQSAHDIKPEEHLAMQKVCQEHIDNSISKTINLPSDYSFEQLSEVIKRYVSCLKGITIYRDKSKGKSPFIPLSLSDTKKYLGQMEEEAAVNDCPSGICDIEKGDG